MNINTVRQRGKLVTAAILSLALGVGATTAANAAFDDVPSEGRFGAYIEHSQAAGIATGFADGTFRPRSSLTRQSAAAWIGRSGTRVGYDYHWATGPDPALTTLRGYAAEAAGVRGESSAELGTTGGALTQAHPVQVMSTVTIEPGAVAGGQGFIMLDGQFFGASHDDTGAGCPCAVDIEVQDEQGVDVGFSVLSVPGPTMDDERPGIGPSATTTVTGVVPVTGGEARTFTVVATLHDSDVEGVLLIGGLAATYVPFGPDGGSDLG